MPRAAAQTSFACAQCGQRYARSEFLRRHERQHQNSKPFPCPEPDCDKSYTRSDVLLNHRRRRHPESFAEGPSSGGGTSRLAAAQAPVGAAPHGSAAVAESLSTRPVAGTSRTGSQRTSARLVTAADTAPPQLGLAGQTDVRPPSQSSYGLLASESPPSPLAPTATFPLVTPTSFDADFEASALPDPAQASLAFLSPSNSAGETLNPGASVLWEQHDDLSQSRDASAHVATFGGGASHAASPARPASSSHRSSRSTVADQWTIALSHDSLWRDAQILGSEAGLRRGRAKADTYDVSPLDPFHIDLKSLGGCLYGVEHWHLPNLRVLSKTARRTLRLVIPHLPFLHGPTFALSSIAPCVSMAIAGCGKPARAVALADDSEASAWDGLSSLIRLSKTDHLVAGVAASRGERFTDYNVGLTQALLIYHSTLLLSDHLDQRRQGYLHLATCTTVARQIGLFDARKSHVSPTLDDGESVHGLDHRWRRWIQAETARRTAFIYLILDTLASAESASPRLIAASELADFPLPAPDPIWSAPDAVSWAVATEAYPFSDRTLADGLATLFDPRGSVAAACRPQDNWRCGPFARLCLVLVILRETIDLGEGKARAEAGALPRWAWWATGDDMRPLLATALDLWRRGYDFDGLSTVASDSPTASVSVEVQFCHEALPFWWSAKVLLALLDEGVDGDDGSRAGPSLGPDRFAGLDYSAVLESARAFSRAGERIV